MFSTPKTTGMKRQTSGRKVGRGRGSEGSRERREGERERVCVCVWCSVSQCTAAAPNQCNTSVPITNDGAQTFKVVVNDYIYAGNNGCARAVDVSAGRMLSGVAGIRRC